MPKQSTSKRRGRPRKISNVISDESEEDYRGESPESIGSQSQEESSTRKRHKGSRARHGEAASEDSVQSEDSVGDIQVEDDGDTRPHGRAKRSARAAVSDEGEAMGSESEEEEEARREPTRSRLSREAEHETSREKPSDTEEPEEYLGSGEYEDYMTKLEAFHRERRKNPFARVVPIGQVTVNLYKLAQSVARHGGVFKLTADKTWRLVAKDFYMPPSYTNGSYLLKQLYLRQLYDFDVHQGRISQEDIAANSHLSGGPSPLSGSPRTASPAHFTTTPRHALARSHADLVGETRRSLASAAVCKSAAFATASPSTSWQTPGGKSIRPLMIRPTPSIASVSYAFPNAPSTGTALTPYPMDASHSHALHSGSGSLPWTQPTATLAYPSTTPMPANSLDVAFVEAALKSINLQHFAGGPKSRIFKALECGLPNEIDWALRHLLEFSNLLEHATLQSHHSASAGSYYQHPSSATSAAQHQMHQVVQLGRNLIISGLLERILVHANPFFQLVHALLTTNPDKSTAVICPAYDATIAEALNAISISTIYGISFEHARQPSARQGKESDFARQIRERNSLLSTILARMMSISVIVHNLTFASVEDIRLLLGLKAFKLYLNKSLGLIRLFAAAAKPLGTETATPLTLASRRVYSELTRVFTPQWIDVGNLMLETLANVSTLMDLKVFNLSAYFLPLLDLALHSRDRYYTATALDTMARWLISDTNAEPLFPRLSSSGLLDHLVMLLAIPDNELAQVVLEFLFQYFDMAAAAQLAITEALMLKLLPTLFDLLYDALEFPAKTMLLKSTLSYSQNLFSAAMTVQQKSIKWIAVAYQAGSTNEIITARDLFHQYAEFSKRENMAQSLTNLEFFNLLTQIYPKSIPPKALWEASSGGASNSLADKSPGAPSVAANDRQPSSTEPASSTRIETSCSCFWRNCSESFASAQDLRSHLTEDHVLLSEKPNCQWMSCACHAIDARHLASHILTHISSPAREHQGKQSLEPPALPTFFYLKPRSMTEPSVKVTEKATYVLQILAQICRLAHIVPNSQREFADFSETEASQCILLHAFFPFLEKLCVYWTIEHAFVLKYVTFILSRLKLFQSRHARPLPGSAALENTNGVLLST